MPIGMLLLSTMNPHTPVWKIGLFMLPVGMGVGLIMPTLNVAVLNTASQADLGTATSASMFFRSMGSAFGVAVFGAVMNSRLAYWFPRLVPASSHLTAHAVSVTPSAVQHLPAQIHDGIVTAFSNSLHVVFLVAAPIAALTLPLALALKEHPLRDEAYMKQDAVAPAAGDAP